jgi:hypothetical protein
MPIRVECPGCHDVTHFADNDAGLAVACLACGRHLRVPQVVAPAIRAAAAPALSEQDRPLSLPQQPIAQLAAPREQPPTPTARRPVQPARPKSRWRTYMLLALILSSCGAIALVIRNRGNHASAALSQNGVAAPATLPLARSANAPLASSPKPSPVTIATTQAIPATHAAPAIPTTHPTGVIAANSTRPYTPAAAPVGFIGFDRLEITGHIEIDSYDAATGHFAAGAAHAIAPLLSNGPIQLTGEGRIGGSVRSASLIPVKASKHLQITGPIAPPLAERIASPPVTLDPFAHDSANSALPREFLQNGSLNLWGAHQLALPAGVYYLNDLIIDTPATLRCQGPVTLLVAGRLNINGAIDTHDNRPADCRVLLTSDKPVTIANKNTLFLDLYAPQSTIEISGRGSLHGSIVGKTLHITGTRPLHFDESLQRPN